MPTRKLSTSPRAECAKGDLTKCRWRSDVNSFPALDAQTTFGPAYVYEYNTRETYGNNITGWGPTDPLNATWWHLVTERASSLAHRLPDQRLPSDPVIRFRDGIEPEPRYGAPVSASWLSIVDRLTLLVAK